MARAYIVLARNDLHGSALQILDLKPNVSQRNAVLEPAGQTHYKTFLGQNDTVVLDGGDADGDLYGLAAYLLDHVDDDGDPLSEGIANDAAAAILERVAAGLSLTSDDVGTILEDAGANNGTLLDDNGSTGSIEEMLRVLSGESFVVPSGTTAGSNGGDFESRSDVTVSAPGGAGRKFSSPIALRPVNTATFRDTPVVVDSEHLHHSALNGALSKLASSSFVFVNPAFSYGSSGTALSLPSTHIGSTGAARAVTVYSADGTVIV